MSCWCCARQSVFSVQLTTAIRCVLAAVPCVRGVTKLHSPYSCRAYFSCPNDTLQYDYCDDGSLFDSDTGHCRPASEVRWENNPVSYRRGQPMLYRRGQPIWLPGLTVRSTTSSPFCSVLVLWNLGEKQHPGSNNIPLFFPKLEDNIPLLCGEWWCSQNLCGVLSNFIFELLIHDKETIWIICGDWCHLCSIFNLFCLILKLGCTKNRPYFPLFMLIFSLNFPLCTLIQKQS